MKNDTLDLHTYHNLLFPYAYNILGSAEDAKDVVQEVLSKYLKIDATVKNEKGYLITSVINQAINIKNRQKKNLSGDILLPEPIATEESDIALHLKDIISYSLLILLEQLNVKERAVFILKEAFNYSHQEIAEVISETKENSRKLLSRAKSKLRTSKRPNNTLKRSESNIYLKKYIAAIQDRDVKKLELLFTEDIQIVADGGNEIKVLRNHTSGKSACIDLMFEVFKKFLQHQEVKLTEINHQPAILYFTKGKLLSCLVFSIDDNEKIYRISSIIDPKKLINITEHIN
ncbi:MULTISPECIES: sigma-70 family RNA polymerase sigma factor [Aquimarina]|uniref:sigma-70 family RNA polymerase sigma factor n=1 Tax=Aquimarina TaxID=290174 RepID=UPI000D691EA3|nr:MULTISPECIES: sigma-70 family RNA polymerase sigma factor [Aquimarina]